VAEAARQDEVVGAVCAAAGADPVAGTPAAALEVTAGSVDRWTMRLLDLKAIPCGIVTQYTSMILAVPADWNTGNS
jgi:hypothetical protein